MRRIYINELKLWFAVSLKQVAVVVFFLMIGNIALVTESVSAENISMLEPERLLQDLTKLDDTDFEDLLKTGSSKPSQEGIASFYASRLTGKRTTSGHRYNPQKFTAAHVSIPIGTVVRVVNKQTGQDVLVTINDRCAAKKYNFIDLSKAAAEKIGILGKGRGRVVIIPVQDNQLKDKV